MTCEAELHGWASRMVRSIVSHMGNSRILYELDHRKPVLYASPIEKILGMLPVVPVGDTGTIPHGMQNAFGGGRRWVRRLPF